MKTLTRDEMLAALNTLKSQGLTYADCVGLFAAPNDDPYVAKAREHYVEEGLTEIDDCAVLSLSEGGQYVSAWVWVDDADIWTGLLDSDGEPCRFINKYHCDDCDENWEDQWSCGCNDKCPTCGAEIEPAESVELDITGKVVEGVTE